MSTSLTDRLFSRFLTAIRHGRRFAAGAALLAATAGAPQTANAALFQFEAVTSTAAGGQLLPCIKVAFNPQNQTTALQARMTPDNSARPVVVNYNRRTNMFTFQLAVSDDAGQSIRLFPPGPCRDGSCQYINVLGVAADGTRLLFHVDLASPDGLVDQASIHGFNPQPEPPGDFAGIGAMQVDFGIAGATAATVSATITVLNQSTGRVVSLQ